MEREGDGERTGTGGIFTMCWEGETGADLAVWRGVGVGEGSVASSSEVIENGMEDRRSENEGGSLPSNNLFLSASVIFLVARLASNFSVRNFSYSTSFVLTFSICESTRQIQIKDGNKGIDVPSYVSTAQPSSAPQNRSDPGLGHQSSPT